MQSANHTLELKQGTQSQGICQTKRGDSTESSLESKRKKLLETVNQV